MKMLEENVAPSGASESVAGMRVVMRELEGGERPRTPEKRDPRGSLITEVAAAMHNLVEEFEDLERQQLT